MLGKTGSVGIVSNQVQVSGPSTAKRATPPNPSARRTQYSLIDSRPIFALAPVCEKYNLKLLTYGSFCGGFLSDRWLNVPSPNVYSAESGLTPSQRKVSLLASLAS